MLVSQHNTLICNTQLLQVRVTLKYWMSRSRCYDEQLSRKNNIEDEVLQLSWHVNIKR